MYLSLRSFKKALNDVIQSRRAIANMNSLYPNATVQDLQDSDNVCIICREEMVGVGINGQTVGTGSLAKKLPCGHIFHVACLRSWFQRQQTCPTCRLDVLRASANTRTADAVRQAAEARRQNQMGNAGVNPDPDRQQMMMNQMFMANFLMNQIQGGNQQPPPAAPQAPTPPSAASTTPPAAGPSTSGAAAPPAFVPAFVPPVAPFMIPPPVMPVPPPDINLSNLSDEELLRLIRRDREGLEARLKLYSQSRTLMDAAINSLILFNSTLAASSHRVSTASESSVEDELTRGVCIPTELLPDDKGKNEESKGAEARILKDSEGESSKSRNISDVRRVRLSKFSGGGSEENETNGPKDEKVEDQKDITRDK